MKQHKAEWTQEQFNLHRQASDLLIQIKDKAFAYIFANPMVSEYEVQQLILAEFRQHNLVIDKDLPIVAFGASSAFPHYFPNKKTAQRLAPNTAIMIDIWSKLNHKQAPFADITWMGFYGQPSQRFTDVYNVVIAARDTALTFLETQLKAGEIPTGQMVDMVCRDIVDKAGFGHTFTHGTGHSIGLTSPHGIWGNIRRSNKEPLRKNLGYTIEPGIYLPGEFGVRSEIDFYIDDNYKLMLTTPAQRGLVLC